MGVRESPGGDQDLARPAYMKSTRPSFGKFWSLLGHPHHALASVLACEQSDQRLGRVFQSLDHVLLDFELPSLDPSLQLRDRNLSLFEIVRHDEALHHQSLDHDEARDAARTRHRRGTVVGRDRSTTDDASTHVHESKAGFENIAPDVVEIDVDAIQGGSL